MIKDCVNRIDAWQHGGNTLLGSVMLLVPIAVAAGMTKPCEGSSLVAQLRPKLKVVVESTTPEDAVNVYEAIGIAKPSGLGKVSELDVNDPDSIAKIRSEKVSLYETFKLASRRDMICSEWTSNFTVTFDVAYPLLIEKINRTKHVNVAVLQAFLGVLSEYPDSFIARKAGIERARGVSLMANKALQVGGAETVAGKKRIAELDTTLRKESNILNPGTTADIICAALALCILDGYRP